MKGEKVTTNLDTRLKLLPKHLLNESVHILNLFIDKVSDEKIVKALEESNGYGRRYVLRLKLENDGKVPKNIIDALRWTLKYVGVGTGVATGVNSTN